MAQCHSGRRRRQHDTGEELCRFDLCQNGDGTAGFRNLDQEINPLSLR